MDLLRRRGPGHRALGWTQAAEGRERNTLARDSYTYLHYPMVAGIILVALGLERTLADLNDLSILASRRGSPSWVGPPFTCWATWPCGSATSTRSDVQRLGLRGRAPGPGAGVSSAVDATSTLRGSMSPFG